MQVLAGFALVFSDYVVIIFWEYIDQLLLKIDLIWKFFIAISCNFLLI